MTQLFNTSTICLIGVVLSVIFTNPLLSQNGNGCFITIDGREQSVSVRSIPSAMSVASANMAMFTSVSEIAGLDNRSAAVTLPARRTSAALYLSDFDLQIPQGVSILGLEVIMTGSASVPDVIMDSRLNLASSATNVIGDNRANQTGSQTAWSDNSTWSYGSDFDHWGTTLNQSMLSQSNFGLIFQIRNTSEEEVQAFIDQVAIKVHYQAALEICGHPCVSLQSLPESDVIDYVWEVDNTLVWSPSNELDHVVNIFAEQSPLGSYEICLTKTYIDGRTDRCCRPLNYTSCETGSIGDRIWEDLNGNGIQDNGEPDLDDYPVFLHTASGELIDAMRSVNGQYRFDNLVGGTYFVRVDPLDRITTPYVSGNTDNNSDIQNVYFFGSTGAITITPGQHLNDIDLGLTSMSSICGHIWRDRDGDGVNDVNPESIDSITVNLFDGNGDLVSSALSDESGRYCFDNLGSDNFQLEFELPAGFGVSSYGPNQLDLATGRVPISLSSGENSDDNDLFAFIYSSIGDEVWEDLDRDGMRDDTEPGLSGIQVSLMDCSGIILQTVESNQEGSYLFSELAPGQYTVCADGSLVGLQPTLQTQVVGSSSIRGDGCTSCLSVLDDTKLTDIDAGFVVATANIGDLVWLDENENGIQDIGELGVPGVGVSLENCQGQEIGFQLTDNNGSYLFSGIPAGEYVLCVDSTDPTVREISTLLGSNECTSCFTHVAGVDLLTMDFAMQSVRQSSDFCGSVWEDVNGNNRLDTNEDRRLSIAVNVFDCNGQQVGTIGAGDDCLEDLPPGEYFIEADIPPGFEQVTFGNNISLNGIGTSPCVLFNNQDISIEIGIVQVRDGEEFSTISVQAIEDINQNGVLDGIESGISGVRVDLINCNGVEVDEAFSNDEGIALFADIPLGDYYVQMEVLPGTSFFNGGDITGENGPATTSCLTLDENQLDITAAYISQFSALSNISGQVWLDLNENGIFDPIEMGMSQVAVRLYDTDFTILEVRYTDANGVYEFFDIDNGEYILQFVRPPLYDYTDFQVTTNPAFGSDVLDPILGMTGIIRLNPGQSVDDIDAGLIPVVTDEAIIIGTVWQDENANSLFDITESGYPDMLILLFEGNGTYHSATFTDDNGIYRFPQLPAGEYQIQFELPDGFVYVDSKVAGLSNFDSEVIDLDIGRTLVFDIGTNEVVDGVNAGLKTASDNEAAIFGRLWIDANNNNFIDNDEPGYRDLIVSLFDSNDNLVEQTMSSASGNYDFSQLASGDYYIQVDIADGYEFVPFVTGQASGGSQIQDLSSGRTLSYRLQQGQALENINIGFIPVEEQRIAIGGKVWIDANTSSTIDQGEAGYNGMDVLLYDADDNFIDVAVTDNLGEYLFPSISPGQYYIDFELPDGFDYVQPLIDGNSNIDSKVVNADDGTTALISLSTGDKFESIHAGIKLSEELPVQISGRVWVDDIPNHLIDGNESGMAETMILLFDQQLQYHSATFTDDEGYYTFPQLRSSGYFVSFPLPDGYEYANFRVGGNSALDSEVQDFVAGRSAVISTIPGEHVRFVNAGIRPADEEPGSISGRMWVDSDGNARDDAFEDGVSGFIVLLFDALGNYHSATFTNDGGFYNFPNITPGDYFIDFDLPSSFSYVGISSPFAISDGSHVSDFINGRTAMFSLGTGQNVENINAGIIDDNPVDPNANIQGRVWIDINANDVEDNTEEGFAGLAVSLLDGQQIFVEGTQTDDEGNYRFNDLLPGDYILEFFLPSGYEYVSFNVGSDSTLDSDVVDLSSGRTDIIALQAGETRSDIDLGLRLEETLTSSISGRVWVDRNFNDEEDFDEEGFQGVTIFLFDEDLELLDTRVSPRTGEYSFSDLAPDNYIIGFSLPSDHDFVHYVSGSDPETNSDIIENNAGRTEIITLQGGVDVDDVDAGVRFREEFLSGIDGRVWVDRNYNDIEESNEEGFGGVTVFLFNEELEILETRVSDDEGLYSFSELYPDNYVIGFSLPSDHDFVHYVSGSDPDTNSDIIENNAGRTEIITLQGGVDVEDIDAGVRFREEFLSGIDGRVWVDRNYNDIEESNEEGFGGVTVFLFNEELEILETRVSDDEGLYSFSELYPDNYVIGFSLPSDYDFVHFVSGSDPDTNSDIIENNAGRTEIITLQGGVDVEDIDAGVRFREEFLSGIDGRVWVDRNYNDIEESNEEGFGGVTVFLFNEELEILETRVSDDVGLYSFSELYPDNYVIGFSLPGDHDFVHFVSGSDPETNSDIIENNAGRTEVFTLSPMQQLSDIDAGVRFREEFLSSINGRVWVDTNRDDEENVGEFGFQGVTVFLFTEELVQLKTRVSDSNGMYVFEELYPDNYIIGFSLPPDHDFVHFSSGSNPVTNSDIIENNAGRTGIIILDPMTIIGDIDAGVRLSDVSNQNIAWISGTTWFDNNENGQLDGDDSRVEGLEVSLLNENGIVLDTRETNARGIYLFNELAAGNYIVEFGQVADYTFTDTRTGVSAFLDSEVTDFSTGRTDIIALGPLDTLMFVNAGYVEEVVTGTGRADITGRVWEDINGNGILDLDEETASGIQVLLFNSDDIQLASTLTTRMGEYIFPAVNSGEYYVSFFMPPDTRSTFMDVGQDESVDSDIRDDSRTEVFNMTGSPLSGLNAGYYFPISIGDAVWIDENQNGIFDIDEQGANNQIISLHDENGTFISRAFSRLGPSGQSGFYEFTDQAPGNYYVRLTPQQGVSYSDAKQGSDSTLDSDITESNGPGTSDLFFIPSGGGTVDLDVGLILEPSTLGDRVWVDSNGNGVQDNGEEGLNGVTVELFNVFDVQVGQTVTATIGGEDGRYLFEDVFPTDYYVKFNIPDGFVFSPSDRGGVDASDSDVDDSNGPGTTSIFLLSPAETDLDLDAGIFADAFIGDRVWHDRDLDGVQGPNEPGIADVNVILFRVEGSENVLIDEAVTTRLGEYRFDNISNGDYFVVFEPGDDFELTDKNAGSDNKLDSDPDSRGVTDVFTITNNQSNVDIDAGLVRPSNLISGLAWDDDNRNGIFDSGELFLEEITVWLLSATGQLLEEQLTGPGGRYLFDNIDNGTYSLQVILPPDYSFTSKDAGVNDDFDSDFGVDGFSDEFTFLGADVFRNVDIGGIRDGRRPPVVYPNPSSGAEVQLQTQVHAMDLPMGCIISDSQGRIIQNIDLGISTTIGKHSWNITTESLLSGIYTVRIRVGRKVDYLRLSIIE